MHESNGDDSFCATNHRLLLYYSCQLYCGSCASDKSVGRGELVQAHGLLLIVVSSDRMPIVAASGTGGENTYPSWEAMLRGVVQAHEHPSSEGFEQGI